MSECCRQSQAEVISNSRNKVPQTWVLPLAELCRNLPDLGNGPQGSVLLARVHGLREGKCAAADQMQIARPKGTYLKDVPKK